MAYKNPEVHFKVCDINRKLIDRWTDGDLPFYEPDLETYYKQAVHLRRNVEFSTEVRQCIDAGDIIFIAVNTPPKRAEHGPVLQMQPKRDTRAKSKPQMGAETDLGAFMSVVEEIGNTFDMQEQSSYHKIIIEKSTVPLGTAAEV